MPSDTVARTGTDRLPEAIRPLADAFHSQLSLASEEVREWHLHHEAAVADPAGTLGRELGAFAAGRIDTTRLAGVVGVEEAPDPLLHHLMAIADDRFGGLAQRGSDAFVVELPPGGDLRDAVRDALAELGRAFALGRVVKKAREHRFSPDEDHLLLGPWPFHRWGAAEKAMAPPLVVELEGADLRAAGLAEFLEGRFRIVLRVRGEVTPAPLARLVFPGVFVAQVAGEADEELAALAACDGPGVVAVFEEEAGALPFVNDPQTGLSIDDDALDARIAEADAGTGRAGLVDLRHLAGLRGMRRAAATTPDSAGTEPGPGQDAPGTEPEVDRLAGWLLAHLPPETDEG